MRRIRKNMLLIILSLYSPRPDINKPCCDKQAMLPHPPPTFPKAQFGQSQVETIGQHYKSVEEKMHTICINWTNKPKCSSANTPTSETSHLPYLPHPSHLGTQLDHCTGNLEIPLNHL